MYFVVGLGNPGAEYENSRHNVGMTVLIRVREGIKFPSWEEGSDKSAYISSGTVGRERVTLILPQVFMNKSGNAVKKQVDSLKKAEKLIVIYDDLDLPFGALKISFGKSSGGHKGLDSIIKTVRTKDFVRIRIGVSPVTPGGKLKKPKGDKRVLDFLMGNFTKSENKILDGVTKKTQEVLEVIIQEGREKGMTLYN
jgi:PTH1 family peptidyl-tRNA hydrolase|tara:strand:- start:5041 stop:5628 length:588 start_codon:yes stop_codon:yes gene_type:complete